jgi:multiple sugar transport system permease protein
MVPYVSVAIPYFALMRSFGLGDTHIAVAIAHTTVSLPLAIWLLASFFESIPTELEEAARVDGCTRLGALFRVIVPLVSGGISVTAIFAFLASWNEFLFALLLTSVRAKTAPLVIAEFNTQYGLEWGTMTAIATLYSLPVILLALFLQKRIVSGLTLGAVKG